jgi:hypothetical protein
MEITENTYKIIFRLGLLCVVVLAILIVMETYAYYFAAAGSARTADLARSDDWHLGTQNAIQNSQKKGTIEGFDVIDPKDEVAQFPNIIDYIERVEEPQFYNRSSIIGCYDNNDIIARAHPGNTCKSWFPKVSNIFFKPKTPADIPLTPDAPNANNYFNVDGQPYSFAELCPETTAQKDPIACLYDRASAFDLMSTKIASINKTVQEKQDQKITNLAADASYHIIDANRTYNLPPIRDFLGYERNLGLGTNIHGGTPGDQLDDLALYATKKRVNYLGAKPNN